MGNIGLYTEDGLHIKFSHMHMITNEFWGTANSKSPWLLWEVNSLLGRKVTFVNFTEDTNHFYYQWRYAYLIKFYCGSNDLHVTDGLA